MPLPFDLVQKLYAAHFPYSWITWEGKLWEDPENQPGLGELIKECKETRTVKLVVDTFSGQGCVQEEGKGLLECTWYQNPEIAVAQYWLSLPHPTPRPEHVDMPIELSD